MACLTLSDAHHAQHVLFNAAHSLSGRDQHGCRGPSLHALSARIFIAGTGGSIRECQRSHNTADSRHNTRGANHRRDRNQGADSALRGDAQLFADREVHQPRGGSRVHGRQSC